jgi:4-diphosphocytidyl-2-C-methyl-D-erythritol kinase
MLFFPNAKINIGLLVHDQRSDGYHDIETLMYPVPLYDVAEFIAVPGKDLSGGTVCQCFGHQPDGHSENLCVKAYRLVRADFDIPPVQISLYKHIPIGAGLGGGSADGAFMLKALNEYFSLGINRDDLATYALRLVSDCPFFITNKPALVSGRGEVIEPVDFSLKGFHLVLVFPWTRINTRDAYAALEPLTQAMTPGSVIATPPESWRNRLQNQFETYVFKKLPVVETIREQLYSLGAVYASMTGSGSAVYGLFREPLVPANMFKDYFLWQCKL